MTLPRKPIALAVVALVIVTIIYKSIFTWPAEIQLQAKQERLVASIEARKWGRVYGLTSETYSDSLGLDKENLMLALKDAGSQFWTKFELNWKMTELERDGDAVVITGNMFLNGEGGPAAPFIVKYARPYTKKPFTFRWRKTGMLPWKWQLESIDHPDAKLPENYTPGELRNRLKRGQF
ncbi:MAG: hypothetical protein ACI8XO_002015 [Verrucomicrobiales bacterium]|jgi:hypothetical protein